MTPTGPLGRPWLLLTRNGISVRGLGQNVVFISVQEAGSGLPHPLHLLAILFFSYSLFKFIFHSFPGLRLRPWPSPSSLLLYVFSFFQ